MSTFVVSLFLPYTVDFQDIPTPARRDSPPATARPPTGHSAHGQRDSIPDFSALDKKASLFHHPTPPRTPASATHQYDDFFKHATSVASHFPKPHDPRSLVRSDSFAPDWGSSSFFNQPKSRAGPAPPDTILEYAKAQERVNSARNHQRRKTGERGPPREKSGERGAWRDKWTIEPAVQGNGGLANAINAAVEAGSMGDVIWVGTLGFPTDSLEEAQKDDIHDRLESEFEALPVYVSDSDFDGHYTHYCKTILWPVFHYQIPDHPKSKAYEDHSWIFYVNLNKAFAEKIIKSYKRGDIVWIHDYHLLLVPKLVRDALPDAQIGFFLHTAFPSSEVFRCLSVRKELLEAMLSSNLVAFQTREYAHHFLQTCSRLLVVEATEEGIQLDNRFVNVTWLPMGINPEGLSIAREDESVGDWIKVMEERYKGKKLIVGRDKMDQVGGIRQKFLAYELFLNKYPEWKDKVVMIQVATSTTENPELAETISDIVTRIDSVHSTLAHQPLVFLRQDIDFSQYLALLSVADVLMVTSLREGLNLTCHEYVFCQDGKASPNGEKKHGPLILSEFTGSAAVFNGQELPVNPWDYKNCAEAIKIALEMTPEEKVRRYGKLRDVVMHHTGEFWSRTLIKSLARVHDEHYKRDTMSIPRLSASQLSQKYKESSNRLFLLDYEGTLATYGSPARMVVDSPQRVLDTLSELLLDPKNTVYVMSGRTKEELEFLFNRVPGLGYIAENGCFVREAGAGSIVDDPKEWTCFPDQARMEEWKEAVHGILQYYQERMEGSWIEQRYCSLIYHYDKAEDLESAQKHAGDCANHINDACRDQRVHAIPVKDAVIIEPMDYDKATAAKYVLGLMTGGEGSNLKPAIGKPDFLCVAGNDRDDEVLYRWANEMGEHAEIKHVTTVSVGQRNTQAQSTLTQGTTGLLSVLQRLSKAGGPNGTRGRSTTGSSQFRSMS
ncbi:alpha,alpha-trehalose phosphate synthase-like protein subunit [Pseudovirgaria hyperparasitica]|uniref:Alpha,alpha-trehalose phosphate synthase-like protein subunit n=1 Tax=Pseudovirgaria hyperparasitica TaxID=470096 RepID=A0A6A6W574_9PEZI|nr:alpha,alpha-trehalose phosphate synthase-like protein subunit [Pseudovirgaria hyperparasitica]KAF2757080.1 alpha,alpha-trehalose phosphate synthase-like protein subunit [Pseudovirgaria hyperparasitica]